MYSNAIIVTWTMNRDIALILLLFELLLLSTIE